MKRKEISFSPQGEEEGFFFENLCTKDWLRDHTSWAPCGIEMKIKGILKSRFWNALHQGTHPFLYSRIHGYMFIFHDWSKSVFVASAVYFVWDTKPDFPTMVSERSSISCLYNMWLNFRIKEKTFSWWFNFLQ